MTEAAAPNDVPTKGAHFLTIFDRVERIYLLILRVSVLVIASALLVYAAWLAASGIYRASLSPNSVVVENSSVAANEIVDTSGTTTQDSPKPRNATTPEQRKFYASLVARYYALFRKDFEPFRHAEDKTLTRDEFDDMFVRSPDRLAAIAEGATSFEADRADLESLVKTMAAAAAEPALKAALKRHQAAKKVSVQHQVERTRSETRSGWNSLSTNCENWFTSPIGCSETRTVQVPYLATETKMEYPAGIKSPGELFHDMQDRYFTLLEQRRNTASADADSKRAAIVQQNLDGAAALGLSWRVVGGFIAIMFFFLLIAIERHQRRLAVDIQSLQAAPTVESPVPPPARRRPPKTATEAGA